MGLTGNTPVKTTSLNRKDCYMI